MKEALVVFAKAPLAGQVKTRLIGLLTPEQAAELYICFLQDTFATLEIVQEEREELSLVLCFTPADEIEAFEAADLDGCLLLAQRGNNLGERLRNCYDDLFSLGFSSVVIIGADSPSLPAELVVQAFAWLATPHSLVLGPCADGGYYLIGMNAPFPQLFENIDWGGPSVLAQTEAHARTIGLTPKLLAPWNDIDTPADLRQLQEQIAAGQTAPRKTANYLQKHLPPK